MGITFPQPSSQKKKIPKSNHPKSKNVCGPKLLSSGHMISSITVGICVARNAHFQSFITKTFPASHVSVQLYVDFTMPNSLLIFWWGNSFPSPVCLIRDGNQGIWSLVLLLLYLMLKSKSHSHVQLFAIQRTLQSLEFSRPEYWSG